MSERPAADAATMAVGAHEELRDRVFGTFGAAEVGQGAGGDDLARLLDDEDLLPIHLLAEVLRRHVSTKAREDLGGVVLRHDAAVVGQHQLDDRVDVVIAH